MTTTRPGEITRIKDLAKDDPYRTEVLTLLAILNERSERQERITAEHTAWQVEHDKKDEIRFERGDARMRALEEVLEGKDGNGGVRSSVNDYRYNVEQFKGAWKALGLIVTVGLVLAGWLGWIWDHVVAVFTAKGHP